MGYTSGWNSLKEIKEHLLRSSSSYDIIDHKSTKYGKNLWLALRNKTNGKGFILLCKISNEGGDWGYKDIDESMGPMEYDCPLSLINKTEGDQTGYAKEWREKVRAYHARIASLKNLEIGETVKVYGNLYVIVNKIQRSYQARSVETGEVFKLKLDQIERLDNTEDFILNKIQDK